MPKSTLDLKAIIRLGRGISIDASKYSTLDLKSMAKLAGPSGATLILRNSDTKSTLDLKSIARHAPTKVIFKI